MTKLDVKMPVERISKTKVSSAAGEPGRRIYLGLFCLTFSTLMFEIGLTRIFSVTMFYHFAFVAISLAMFGLTVGALWVHLAPGFFPQQLLSKRLAQCSLLFTVTIAFSFMMHLAVPFVPRKSLVAMFGIFLNYAAIAIPFIVSGVAVCLILTRFPKQVSRLYAFDLIGAALGCLGLAFLLSVMDGPSAVIAIAAVAALAAYFFAKDAGNKKLVALSLLLIAGFGLFSLTNAWLAKKQNGFLRIMWVKEKLEPALIYEKWNPFSRVTVSKAKQSGDQPFLWAISPQYPIQNVSIKQLLILIDASAGTPIMNYKGNPEEFVFLKYEMTNIAHYLRANADVAIIGPGGGKDILSALVFNQKSVLAVEINYDINKIVHERLADFSGNLLKDPRVHIVSDEARSYITRQNKKFDIIQISLIDTWAATAAGAYVLSENSLYTAEGWKIFLEHLNQNGILTVSRSAFRDAPDEIYRLTALGVEALRRTGIKDARSHMIIMRYNRSDSKNVFYQDLPQGLGIGNLLVNKSPYTAAEIDQIEKLAKDMDFEVILSPRYAMDSTFEDIFKGEFAHLPLNYRSPTDDNPFFFHMLRLRDIFNTKIWKRWEFAGNFANLKAVVVLGTLFMTVTFLTIVCVFIPLILKTTNKPSLNAWPSLLYFAAIGSGFMLVEIAQMQRLNIFLGHPMYSLCVVLSSVLLSSGFGSMFIEKFRDSKDKCILTFTLLLGVLFAVQFLTEPMTVHFASSGNVSRIILSILILLPMGFLMGTVFPIGMRWASQKNPALTPWFWGVNGATSVWASVFSMVISLNWGISCAFGVGIACYGIAILSFLIISNSRRI